MVCSIFTKEFTGGPQEPCWYVLILAEEFTGESLHVSLNTLPLQWGFGVPGASPGMLPPGCEGTHPEMGQVASTRREGRIWDWREMMLFGRLLDGSQW